MARLAPIRDATAPNRNANGMPTNCTMTIAAICACCGMPKFELGDLEGVARLKEINLPVLAPLARAGYAILTAVPSESLPV